MGSSFSCQPSYSPSPSPDDQVIDLPDLNRSQVLDTARPNLSTPSPRSSGLPTPTKSGGRERPRSLSRNPDSKDSKGKSRSQSSSSGPSTSTPGDMSSRINLSALRNYATLPSPSTSIPSTTLLLSNPYCIAIFDAYPKAKYHFLVLPKYPFPSQSEPDSKDSLIKLDALDDLKSLMTKTTNDVRAEVIHAMSEMAREVEEMIRDEMYKTEGFEWRIDVGFHAIPSMKHIHLHVISEDRISPAMKTKKHYNSFRPDLGFFLNLMEVQRWLVSDDQVTYERVNSLREAQTLLDTPLTCFKCDEPFHNIPKLKSHLEKEFEKEKRTEVKRIKTHGRQRSDEDEMF